MTEPTEKQIAELQSQLAFQEDELEKLHSALYQQQLRMDALEQKLKAVIDRQKRSTEGAEENSLLPEPPPPHY